MSVTLFILLSAILVTILATPGNTDTERDTFTVFSVSCMRCGKLHNNRGKLSACGHHAHCGSNRYFPKIDYRPWSGYPVAWQVNPKERQYGEGAPDARSPSIDVDAWNADAPVGVSNFALEA